MVAPSAPTLATIAAEGLKKAGYNSNSSQYTTLLTRAQNEWIEEVKTDLWNYAKKLTSLQTKAYRVTTRGKSSLDLPTDFSSPISFTILDGQHTGSVQAGSTSGTIVLDASESADETWIIGKEILVTTGTGANQAAQVLTYSSSTKTATITPSWVVTPVASDGYMIVDRYSPLYEYPVWDYDKETIPTTLMEPKNYYPIGDEDDGQILFVGVPDKTYGVRIRYYADLKELDLAGTLMGTLYKRWRNLFVQGVCAKALQDMDDNRADAEVSKYNSILMNVGMRESYGDDLSNLVPKIEA